VTDTDDEGSEAHSQEIQQFYSKAFFSDQFDFQAFSPEDKKKIKSKRRREKKLDYKIKKFTKTLLKHGGEMKTIQERIRTLESS
jgi:hypothetical protein